MYELSSKDKYIIVALLALVLVLLVFYKRRKLEHLDPATTEAVKNMASIYNQNEMVVKKLQATDTLGVGTNASIGKVLTTTDLTVNNNATISKDLTVGGNATIANGLTVGNVRVNKDLAGLHYEYLYRGNFVAKFTKYDKGITEKRDFGITWIRMGYLVHVFIGYVRENFLFTSATVTLPDSCIPAGVIIQYMEYEIEGVGYYPGRCTLNTGDNQIYYLLNHSNMVGGISWQKWTVIYPHVITYMCK